MSKLQEDPRIDPQIKAKFGDFGQAQAPNASSRAEVLAMFETPEGKAMIEMQSQFFRTTASEEVAPSKGLVIRTETFASAPDGNQVKILFIRPEEIGRAHV